MRDKNLLGQLIRHHDEAGLTAVAAADFKGNVLDKSRRVIADAPILAVFKEASANGWRVTPFVVDWSPRPQKTLADREGELLETTVYQTTSSVDALNRIKRLQLPQDVDGKRRELRPIYNNAGGLEKVFLDDTLYVERIAYDAKAQRALIAYGNGVMTRYAYDPHVFRLKRLRSEHYSKPNELTYRPSGEPLQDFGYDYDLVGNILAIRDRAPGSGILNNPEAAATSDLVLAQLLIKGDALNRRFDYDPIYRLLSANGRECDRPPDGEPWQDQPRCADLTKARAYTENYAYDPMGNILRLDHRNNTGGFARVFTVETANNRLREVKIGDSTYDYEFDTSGNTLSETTSRHFEWGHADQMKAFGARTEGAEPSVYAHYFYNAAGQRVKKLLRKQGGQVEVTHYIDAGFEHHRWGSGAQAAENNHVHVMDDKRRIALARFGTAHPDDRGPAVKFHLGDHLDSSNMVVDTGGALVNREEFTPYGETSFGSFARKRYRFTGMERDEESGLNYHGARYLSPFLGRWLTCDPISASPSRSAYEYSSCCPINRVDPTGNDDEKSSQPASLSPIYQGSENRLFQSREVEYPCNGCECTKTYINTHTLNREGLKAFLLPLARGALTSFEQSLIDKWGTYEDPELRPITDAQTATLIGYELTTGQSGDRIHTLYTRSGEHGKPDHTEEAPVPANWVLLLAPVGRFALRSLTQRDLGGSLTQRELVHLTSVEGAKGIGSSALIRGARGIFAVPESAAVQGTFLRMARTGLMPGNVAEAVPIPRLATGLFSRVVPSVRTRHSRLLGEYGLRPPVQSMLRPGHLPPADRVCYPTR
jgi:RHS repeat-associated protein